MNWTRILTPLGWLVMMIVVAVVIAALVYLAGGPARRDATLARASAAMANARSGSAAEATETIAERARQDGATDQLTQENAYAILESPGADQRLDPDLARSLRNGLCRRPAYRGSRDCLQHADSVQPPAPGPGR